MLRHAHFIAVTTAAAFFIVSAPAADDGPAKGVKKIELSFDPSSAKPGQTVTVKITVELEDGFHTYPTKQTDKNAESYVSKIAFPGAGDLIFVGDVKDPNHPQSKAEPEAGVKELKFYTGTFTYERKAVVSPQATSGEKTVKLKSLRLTVCDEKNCYPPKMLTPDAKLKVLDGPAVEVEKEFQDEVKKALAEKK
jgi:hypothetical protein